MTDSACLITPYLIGREYSFTHNKANVKVIAGEGVTLYEYIPKKYKKSVDIVNFSSIPSSYLKLSLNDFSAKMGWM